ncbi:MAG: TolC family protein, partial [Bacteroidia bacterium]|nr:TolC family protein [Bacteroidia bacterium]
PEYDRIISKITLPNGEDAFVARRLANSSAGLNINQNLGFSGGKIFVSSNLQRIDLFGDSNTFSYLSSPVNVGFIQPVFAFNPYKWEKKIEPLKYLQAKNAYIESIENLSVTAVTYFFDLALAQQNLLIAEVNYHNNDTLYKISQGRYDLGKIAQNDLLQMELEWLNSDAELNNARLDIEMKKLKMKSFLGLNDNEDIEIIIPVEVPSLKVDVSEALELSKKNSSNIIDYKTQLIEAQRDVARSRSEDPNLSASFGLTQSALTLAEVYKNPQDQQMLSLGLQVPIIDWGLGKGKYRMAKSNAEVIKINVDKSIFEFEQGVYLQVAQFNMQEKQLKIAAKADTVAQMRFEVSKQRFYIGKIDITDLNLALNLALNAKDLAKRNYIDQLKNYWLYYYTIRKLTLCDFEKKQMLTADFRELVK